MVSAAEPPVIVSAPAPPIIAVAPVLDPVSVVSWVKLDTSITLPVAELPADRSTVRMPAVSASAFSVIDTAAVLATDSIFSIVLARAKETPEPTVKVVPLVPTSNLSVPFPPVIESTNAAPEYRSACSRYTRVSLPSPALIVSAPAPPVIVSAPEPPVMISAPEPALIVSPAVVPLISIVEATVLAVAVMVRMPTV